MTGKEALRLVHGFEEARVRYLSHASDDATLKLVATWRLTEREAFDELVTAAGIAPSPEREYKGRTRDAQITAVVHHFLDEWSTQKAAALAFNMPQRRVMGILGREARRRGFVVLREKHPEHGLRWKAVPKVSVS